MSDNPFTSPETSNSMPAGMPSQDVYEIAKRQRWLIGAIGATLLLIVSSFVMPGIINQMPEGSANIAAILYAVFAIAVRVFVLVCVFSLARQLYGTGIGILMLILSLLPLIGLIVLIMVNMKATKFLQQHGVKVGLMGADLNEVRP